MNIVVSAEGMEAKELIELLAGTKFKAACVGHAVQGEAQPAEKVEVLKEETKKDVKVEEAKKSTDKKSKNTSTAKTKEQPAAKEADENEASDPLDDFEADTEGDETVESPEYTEEDVAQALRKALTSKTNGKENKEAIQALFKKLGVKGGINNLPKDKYAEVIEAAQAMA